MCFASVCMLLVITTERHDIPGCGWAAGCWVHGKLDQNVRAGELHNIFEFFMRVEVLTVKVSFSTAAEVQFLVFHK